MNSMLWFVWLVTMAMVQCNEHQVPDVCGNLTVTGPIEVSISDTTTNGTILTNSSMKVTLGKCGYYSDVIKQSENTFILAKDASSICVKDAISCSIKCDTTAKDVRFVIERTLTYTITFDAPSYYGSVVEMVQNETSVNLYEALSLIVTSCNSSSADARYSLITTENLPFYWGAETRPNDLKVAGLIDYERNKNITFLVEGTVTINKNETSTATATIVITVNDTDDNKPEFSKQSTESYVLEVDENIEFDEPRTTTPPINAFDPDEGLNKTIQYSLIDTYDGLFAIDKFDGKINVTRKLDYETKSSYTIIVKAAQEDQPLTRTALATLLVKVIDVDDHKPEFAQKSYDCSIVEHSIEGTFVCGVKAVDGDGTPENRNFTYIIWGGNKVIDIDEKTGVISVTNSTELDRDKSIGNQFTITVGTKMLNGSYGENTTVTIKVIDINDNNPEFTQNGNYTFDLDNTALHAVVGTVNATDKDADKNGEVSYEILSAPIASGCIAQSKPGTRQFGINETTGEVSIINANTVCQNYRFIVQACDHGLNRRCTIASVQVRNSKAGDLKNVTQSLEVTEGRPIGSYIGFVEFSGIEGSYEYDGRPEISIDNATGMLVTKQILDREANDTFNFLVKVKSDGKLLCNANVTVLVQDINDNPPKFEKSFYHFELPPAPVVNKIIGSLKATDKDLDENSNVSYSLKDSSLVKIDMMTGNLSIQTASIERIDIVRVYVVAMDNGVPALQSNVPVYISGTSEGNTIPISTPMTLEAVDDAKAKLSGEISEILNMVVVIKTVTSISDQDSSTFRSKVHIAPQNTKFLNETFLSAVVSHYEDVKNVFYQASSQHASEDNMTALSAPEIGLIAMACVILIGTIAAIVIIQRQFNSQKRYRQLFETMTKNSSMYESQELKMDVEDEGSNADNGSVNEEDFGNTSTPPSPTLAVSAQNPTYVNEEGSNVNLNDSVRHNENVDVNNALRELTDSYEKEDNDITNNNNEGNQDSSPVVNANLHNSDDGGDIHSVVDIEPELEENDNELHQGNDDLIHFDNESNGEFQSDATKDEPKDETEPDNDEIDDEPNPDYEIKQVRFHCEVLDADENKIEPLKVKSEDIETKEIDETIVVDEEEDVDDEIETDQTDSNAANISHTSGYSSDNPSSEENDIEANMQDANGERVEEEIDAPEKEQFYFDSIESTQF